MTGPCGAGAEPPGDVPGHAGDPAGLGVGDSFLLGRRPQHRATGVAAGPGNGVPGAPGAPARFPLDGQRGHPGGEIGCSAAESDGQAPDVFRREPAQLVRELK